jgi:hypothetical protein
MQVARRSICAARPGRYAIGQAAIPCSDIGVHPELTGSAVSLKTREIKILVQGGYFGRYLPTGDSTGHLVYVHAGVLFGVPFDPTRLGLRGTAVPRWRT